TTGYIAIRGSTPGYTRWMYLAISTHAVDYLEYQGARSLPATYDPDTGEVTLSRPVDVVGDTVRVAYRALGRKSVTLGMTPVTDIRIITSVGMPTDGTNYAANKQFDGATGRVTFNPILPWGTRCLRAEYTAADIENIVPSDTLTYLEGGRPHPIVRPTDDLDQRYTTLQPDPSPSLQYVTVAHPGLYHGVSRIENEIVPYAGQGPGLALALAQGRPNLNGWVLNNEADDSADPPVAASPDYIVTQYPSVWVKEAFIMTADGPEDISNILGVTWLPDAAAPGGGHWVLSIPEDSKLDDSYQGAPIQITYWMPGTAQVLVFGPSPMPATVYPIELNGYSQPKYDQLRVNVNMLFQDEDTEGWRWRAQGLNDSSYNILGVYDRADLTGWNYFDAGRGSVVQDASNAAILKLNMTPAPWINTLYIKVSTYAIDGVFPDTGLGMPDFNDNRYPGAMNTLALADPWNAGLTHAAYNADVVTAWPLPDDDEDTPTEMHLTEIHLARPLDTAGQQVWVSHRVLLPNPAIFGDQPVPPSITPTRGPLMAVPLLSYWDPEANAPVEIQEGLIDQPPVWQAVLNPFDPDNWCPYGTRAFYEIRYHAGMCVSGIYTSATYAYGLGRWGLPNDYQPMYPAGMNVYRAAVSAGVNMSAYRQQPRYDMYDAEDAVMLRDPRLNPVDYAPNLVCNLDASPQTVSWIYVEATSPDVLGEEPDINESGAVSATIHSCNGGYGRHDTPTYGGVLGLDFLTNYPGQNWPVEFVGPDPLIAVPPSPIVPAAMTPDDGAGSTTFDFYVRYWNADNLPPLPWMDQWVDIWGGSTSGVVLFIDSADVLDLGEEHRNHSWRPFFMQPVDLADTDYTDGCDYMYRLQPCASPWVFDPDVTPWPPTPIFCNDYVSLMVGTYHYFFACSDDSLTFEEPDQFLLWYQAIGNVGDPWSDWGNRSPLQRVPFRSSNGLDPHVERYVLDDDLRPWMPRAFGRRYSAFGDDAQDPQDWQLFVDRYSRVPGNFEHGNELIYPWSSVNHPQVTVALQGFSSGRTDGLGRFYGTLQPFYRAVNPAIETPWTEDGFDWMGTRTETCGATKSTTLTFRVKYYQRDNQAPLWVKVFINNESLKVFNYDNGQRPTPENGGYVGYTMQPAEIQTTPGQSQKPPYNYTIGVDYEFKTQLPPGPHTYYFLANDGKQTALYPARPEDWNYPNNPIGEWWLPPNRGDCPFGFDNNYIPGPYVNNPCELSSPSVSPSTGTQGQQFVY
ncbi:MAG TPA: hypothetical protein PLZ21_02810, partial [Armatimonadota bacterium]|nr:hypothetical protein [Armatimonadota bacterium]